MVGESAFWDLWHKMGDAFAVVLDDEELLLNEFMEAFASKVDGKLVGGIESGSGVLGSGKVEKANEGDKVVSAEASPVNGKLEVAEMENGCY